jgi:hypothetical protein
MKFLSDKQVNQMAEFVTMVNKGLDTEGSYGYFKRIRDMEHERLVNLYNGCFITYVGREKDRMAQEMAATCAYVALRSLEYNQLKDLYEKFKLEEIK